MMNWPAILKLPEDDILYYIESSAALQVELQNHYLKSSDQCFLIDSLGQQINFTDDFKPVQSNSKPAQFNLPEFNQLVREHLSARQQCCVLKIMIQSYQQGFDLIKNTAES